MHELSLSRTDYRNRQTDGQTGHATVTAGRIYVHSTAMRPKNRYCCLSRLHLSSASAVPGETGNRKLRLFTYVLRTVLPATHETH